MAKIKEILERIKGKYLANQEIYTRTKLETSKVLFIFMATIYYFSYLSILAGFNVEMSSRINFIIYPAFIFSIMAILYDLFMYWIVSENNDNTKYKMIPISILSVLFVLLIGIHFGINF